MSVTDARMRDARRGGPLAGGAGLSTHSSTRFLVVQGKLSAEKSLQAFTCRHRHRGAMTHDPYTYTRPLPDTAEQTAVRC